MQGAGGDISVDLKTTAVGKKRGYSFPYFAFGYAIMYGTAGLIVGTEGWLGENSQRALSVNVPVEEKLTTNNEGVGK